MRVEILINIIFMMVGVVWLIIEYNWLLIIGLINWVRDWMFWVFFSICFCLLLLRDFESILLNDGLKIELFRLKKIILIIKMK